MKREAFADHQEFRAPELPHDREADERFKTAGYLLEPIAEPIPGRNTVLRYRVVEKPSVSDDTIEMDALQAETDEENTEETDTDSTPRTGKGRHHGEDNIYVGRHTTRAERERRRKSRVPAILGRAAYALAARVDNYLQDRDEPKWREQPSVAEYQIPTVPETTANQAEERSESTPYQDSLLAMEAAAVEKEKTKKLNKEALLRRALGTVAGLATVAAGFAGVARATMDTEQPIRPTSSVSSESTAHDKSDITKDNRIVIGPKVDQPSSESAALNREALAIDDGEGLNKTFKDMGISETKWRETMMKTGKKLTKMGETYWDAGAGEYRLKGDGHLSREAAKYIFETATKIK